MVGAMACFIANDALVKYVSADLPAAQLIFIRGVFATALVFLVVRSVGALGQWTVLWRGWVPVRALVDCAGSVLYLLSLFNLPLGNATAINLAAPLAITAFAAWFLREAIPAGRWLAIMLGFVGVLMVIQPRADGFNGWAWVCLLGTLFHATRDLLTRKIPVTVPAILITLSTAIAVTLGAGLWSVFQGWAALRLSQLGLLACASGFLAIAYHLIIQASRAGDFSVIAPFRYTGLLWALLIGWLTWGEMPNALAWAGIALLIGAGLSLLRPAQSPPG